MIMSGKTKNVYAGMYHLKINTMKKCIPILIAFCFSVSVAFAQSSGSWNGSDVPGHTFAEFSGFTGKQGFQISVPEGTKTIRLNYSAAAKRGQLKLIIQSKSGKLLEKNIDGEESDSLTIHLPDNRKCRIYVVGKEAAGNFNIWYSPSATVSR